MSLVQSAKLNEHDPHAYLKDVLRRLRSHPARRIDELPPHRGQSASCPSTAPSRDRAPLCSGADLLGGVFQASLDVCKVNGLAWLDLQIHGDARRLRLDVDGLHLVVLRCRA